jgi:hypothetical protein
MSAVAVSIVNSSDPPTAEQAKALACAVIDQALTDLRGKDASLRADARHFFEVGLWVPNVPWARLLGLDKDRFLAALRKTVTREYLALPLEAA